MNQDTISSPRPVNVATDLKLRPIAGRIGAEVQKCRSLLSPRT